MGAAAKEWIGKVVFDSGEIHWCDDEWDERRDAVFDAQEAGHGGGPHRVWAVLVGGRADTRRRRPECGEAGGCHNEGCPDFDYSFPI